MLSARVEANAVPPHRFKAIMGRHCADYGTSQQQDASYFFMHFLSLLESEERTHAARLQALAEQPPCSRLFAFSQEQRVQCGVSGAVSYTAAVTTQLSLRIPLDAAANRKEVDEYKARESTRQELASSEADAYIGAAVCCRLSSRSCTRNVASLVPDLDKNPHTSLALRSLRAAPHVA